MTRGERIRRKRRLLRLSMQALADQVGISARTLGAIERSEDISATTSRTIDLIEDHLGLTNDTPTRTQSPPLDQATNTELAFEVYRRLAALDHGSSVEQLPDAARDDPDRIAGPPAPGTTRRGDTGSGHS